MYFKSGKNIGGTNLSLDSGQVWRFPQARSTKVDGRAVFVCEIDFESSPWNNFRHQFANYLEVLKQFGLSSCDSDGKDLPVDQSRIDQFNQTMDKWEQESASTSSSDVLVESTSLLSGHDGSGWSHSELYQRPKNNSRSDRFGDSAVMASSSFWAGANTGVTEEQEEELRQMIGSKNSGETLDGW